MHVKDKRIELDNFKYRAIIEYYRDKPSRDRHKPVRKIFETMTAAQKFLEKYPRDIWDGFAINDYKYREIDERKNKRIDKPIFNKPFNRKETHIDWVYGRTLVHKGVAAKDAD